MPKGKRVSVRGELFCQALMGEARGNLADAARMAGYSDKGKPSTLRAKAARLRATPAVVARLAELATEHPLVKSREALQKFWSETVDDKGEQMKDRLKASELLGKTHGIFVDRTETSVNVTGENAQVVVYFPDNGRGGEA